MGIEYKLGQRESGTLEISCEDPKAIITCLGIHGFGDCISFYKKNNDGSKLGSIWDLNNIGCFKELRSYERLKDMPKQEVKKLAARMYELLFIGRGNTKYGVVPCIDNNNVRFNQIYEQLLALQATEKKLVKSGELVFPAISEKELAFKDDW